MARIGSDFARESAARGCYPASGRAEIVHVHLKNMADPTGFEPVTSAFGGLLPGRNPQFSVVARRAPTSDSPGFDAK